MIRVLIVDDSATMRQMLCQVLQRKTDIEVVGQAVNGQQAVDMALSLEPDLITMDVIMPGMNGLEATRRIMQRRPTKILIISAHTNSDRMNIIFEAMTAGALEVMSKYHPEHSSKAQWEQDLLQKVTALAALEPTYERENNP